MTPGDLLRHKSQVLGLVEPLAKFNGVLQEHVRHLAVKNVHDHSLSKDMRNEFIQIQSHKVRKEISELAPRRYYSIILDCTRNAARRKQIKVIARFVNAAGNIEKGFLCFLDIDNMAGKDPPDPLN